MKKLTLLSLAFFLTTQFALAQTSLLDELDKTNKDDEETTYTKSSFKTNRVINLHSMENTAAGVLDMKISHRFGIIDEGFYDIFGLDNASIRIGADFGVTDNFQIGLNRNSFRKAYDAYGKYRILRQSTGKKNMPITLSLFSSLAVESIKFDNPDRDNKFSSRLFFTNQLIVGRKFSDLFTLQLSPTVVHRNLVPTKSVKNTVLACGVSGRLRLSRRVALNAEYIYVLPDQLAPNFSNSLSLGVDIETGGHVFQLHFTNSNSMSEYSYITQTENNWGKNAIRFGFNVSRVFTVWDNKNRQ